jgi:hypothetical protein
MAVFVITYYNVVKWFSHHPIRSKNFQPHCLCVSRLHSTLCAFSIAGIRYMFCLPKFVLKGYDGHDLPLEVDPVFLDTGLGDNR